MVLTRITAEGRRLVDELDGPMRTFHLSQLGHMSDDQLRALSDLLTLARQPV